MAKTLTPEQHLRLAQHLRNIENEITGIRDVIFRCGQMTRVGQRVFALNRKISEIKSALDDVMFRDHPNDARTQQDVYYGPREQE